MTVLGVNLRSMETCGTILIVLALLVLLFAGPQIFDLFMLFKVTLFVAMAILALSMGFIWGYGGILCFGQSAFYGLGAYSYAIAVGNFGESTAPFLLAIIVPAAFAALLGYFMFYGRLSDVYLAVVTLAVTLILYNFMRSTAGEEYAIGAQRLMGFNGISSVQPINWPGDGNALLFPDEIFHLSMGCLILCYVGLKFLNRSHFGRVAVAIRENELRAELLGYDVRLHKLQTFTIGGGMAGLAGCLGVNFQLLRQPGCVRPQLRGRDHHVDADRRARHPGRADDRLYRASDAKVRDRPAADHQHLPDFRRYHYGIRAVGAGRAAAHRAPACGSFRSWDARRQRGR